jgi:hypothetical protein
MRLNHYWIDLSSQASADLAGVIGRTVVNGKNSKIVRAEITERLNMSKYRAALCTTYRAFRDAARSAVSQDRGRQRAAGH